jgi:acyl-CoA dehydrogenase
MSQGGTIARTLFNEEHEAFRDSVRKFLERDIAPQHAKWEEEGIVSRDAWRAAGLQGILCMTMPEEFGGLGLGRLYSVVLIEEMARLGLSGPFFYLHSEIVAPYINNHGSETQKRAWLPRMATGEAIGAIAMTEPSGGSDLQAMRTVAIRDGDDFVINGQKTFISNGQLADVVVVAAKTDPKAGASGVSLFLVEGDAAGFTRGRNLQKMGGHAQDTSELFFSDVRVPATSLLGQEGRGFYILMQELAWERLMIAIRAVTTAEVAIAKTTDYAKERKAFGKSLFDMQHNRFKLAEHHAQVQVTRVFVDRCIDMAAAGQLDATVSAVAKFQTTELMMRVLDDCVQMHGGYGYMWEYFICRAFADGRYSRIAGGSNEVMRELISRTL